MVDSISLLWDCPLDLLKFEMNRAAKVAAASSQPINMSLTPLNICMNPMPVDTRSKRSESQFFTRHHGYLNHNRPGLQTIYAAVPKHLI